MEITDFSSLVTFTAIDFETANGKLNSICQVGLVRVENGIITHELEILVQPPGNEYHWGNSRVHGINRTKTAHAPTFDEVWAQMAPFIAGQDVVAHNASFDCSCLDHTLDFYHIPIPTYKPHCTVKIYKRNLALLCQTYGIELVHHNALSDARACAVLFLRHLSGHRQDAVAE